nr:AN1-type zinc finger protein 3 isoform X4 [Chrysemys picta bellii]
MGDAGSERSKAPSLPPRCPCGFWGSSKTMNLCSKCFAEKRNPHNEKGGPCTGTPHVSLTTPTKRSCDSVIKDQDVSVPFRCEDASKQENSQSESEASPVKRPRLLEDSNDRPEETSRSKQKSRRRCFQCQTKLELVQQELGSCRCGYVFCMLHRLPEQHDCTFDHMGRGREEAIMKMVKLDRKVGRSCQRIGEGCS